MSVNGRTVSRWEAKTEEWSAEARGPGTRQTAAALGSVVRAGHVSCSPHGCECQAVFGSEDLSPSSHLRPGFPSPLSALAFIRSSEGHAARTADSICIGHCHAYLLVHKPDGVIGSRQIEFFGQLDAEVPRSQQRDNAVLVSTVGGGGGTAGRSGWGDQRLIVLSSIEMRKFMRGPRMLPE